jgi:hypothetical protein
MRPGTETLLHVSGTQIKRQGCHRRATLASAGAACIMHLQIADLRKFQRELMLVVFVSTPLFVALCCALRDAWC